METHLIELKGNIGNLPSVRSTKSGKAVMNLNVAVEDDGGQTLWRRVTLWGGLALAALEQLRRGDFIRVTGVVKQHTYQNREGSTVETTEVHGRSFARLYRRSAA